MTTTVITYRKNPVYSEAKTPELPRLFASLDLSGFGITTQVKSLSIYYRKLSKPVGPVRVVYSAKVAGLLLEAGNLRRLEQIIDDTLKPLIRLERLPMYFFQVDDSAWPIYDIHNELTTRYPGGPVFTANDIASLRLWLGNHFKGVGRIQNRREMDLLYLSPYDLQLYAPYCVLRTPDEAVADIPVFPISDGKNINLMAPINGKTLATEYASGKGIFTLFDQVSDYLSKKKLIRDPYEITIRKLSAKAWERIASQLPPESNRLTYLRDYDGKEREVENPVFIQEKHMLAARSNRFGRFVLYLAPDLDKLSKNIGDELYSYGALKDPKTIKVMPVSKV